MRREAHIICLASALTLLGPGLGRAVLRDPIEVTLADGPNGLHFLQGSFMVDTSTRVAWQTLTDYEGLPAFVSSMRSSRRMVERTDGLFVEQVMAGRVGFFRKKISTVLKIEQEEPVLIKFTDVLNHSFRVYTGSWEIAQWDNGLAVTYKLQVRPAFFAPDFIANNPFRRTVQALLEEVREEMIRRAVISEKQAG
jgi:hypothetical protein